ncbi:MAG TPA: CsgG/HfaB family protein [Rariglobus sp.]|nr:CsgG/HfaB family protein [Rariglobus sp.]
MKTTTLILRALCAFGLACTGLVPSMRAQAPEAAAPLPMAVFDFQTTDRALEKKGTEVAVLLGTYLSIQPELFLVERQEIDKVLGEQEAGLSGAISAETAAKVGSLVGAKVLVTGRVFESGGKVFIAAKIMGTETGRVYGELATAKDVSSMDTAVEGLAGKIGKLVQKQATTFVAKVETQAERVERLKKLVAGKTLPPVYVSVVEQHLARPVIDPAVQTEMMLILKEVGFPVLTVEETAGRSDVVTISGEAFSELAGRRGNLVSCRSRVEIVVKQKAVLMHTDRQTDVAIDLAEHIAGKKALENAALKLLDRLVPKLAL